MQNTYKTVGMTEGAQAPGNPFGRIYTPRDLAELWQLSEQTIRRLFQDLPGVLKIGDRSPRGKRGYVTLRIPASVAEHVFRERSE